MKKTMLTLAAAGIALAAAVSAAPAADKLKVGFIYIGPVGALGWR